MPQPSRENPGPIRFEGELLPDWAQPLHLAAELCKVPYGTRHWFWRFSKASGTDDARTIVAECEVLRAGIQTRKEQVFAELRRSSEDTQPAQIIAAWLYALDTMIQQSSGRKTCSWTVEGSDSESDPGDGNITLRRV